MTMMDIDTSTIEHLDFDLAIPCDNETHADEKCDKAAEWKLTLACCGTVIFYCTEHKNLIFQILEETPHAHHNEEVGGCGNKFKVLMVEPL